jgi:putative ABC transport system permease protein
MLITTIAFLLAVICVNALLPAFNAFTNKQLTLGAGSDYRIWLLAVAFAAITGLLSGSYPAFMLSNFKPVLLLRGFTTRNRNHLSLRKILVVFQFATSVVMIVATMVLVLQVRFLTTADLGFNKELMVVVDVNTGKARENYAQIKTDMQKIPTVKNVSVTSRVPGEWKSYRVVHINKEGSGEEPLTTYLFGADQDFAETFGVKISSGRNFANLNDSGSVILNETAARMLNITEASGQLLEIPEYAGVKGGAFNQLTKPFRVRVVGIVKDFHFQSLRDKIEPLVLAYAINPIQPIDYYTARVDPSDVPATLAKMKAIMVQADPGPAGRP